MIVTAVLSKSSETHFCIIQTRSSETGLTGLQEHLSSLGEQTYQNFELVYHFEIDSANIEEFQAAANSAFPGRSKMLKSLSNTNKDVYDAVTQ